MISPPAPHTIVVLSSLLAASGALTWAAVSDVRRYIIPNAASVIILFAFVAMALSAPPAFAIGGLAVGAATFVVACVLFAAGRMGGGDVKLLASLALWAGPALMAPFAIVTCLSALVLSALMLSPLRALMPPASASASAMTGSDMGTKRPMPFGVAIVAGGFYLIARRFADGQ